MSLLVTVGMVTVVVAFLLTSAPTPIVDTPAARQAPEVINWQRIDDELTPEQIRRIAENQEFARRLWEAMSEVRAQAPIPPVIESEEDTSPDL